MHLDLRHLRTIQAIHEAGGLGLAAARLGLTQSALSHQVKALEAQAGVPLVVRASKPLRLSPAGLRLLDGARTILPLVDALEAEMESVESGRAGRMHVAIECHACFEWLLPVMAQFRRAWPAIDIDIRPGLAFDALPALRREEVDLVVGGEAADMAGLTLLPLFDYEPVWVGAADHPLAARVSIRAADLADATLLTYPVDRSRLDVFTDLLGPAGIEPREVRPVELTAMILLLVAAGRGVAVLPDWVVRAAAPRGVVVRPLDGRGGAIRKRLFAAVRSGDAAWPPVGHLVRLARAEAVRLQAVVGGGSSRAS